MKKTSIFILIIILIFSFALVFKKNGYLFFSNWSVSPVGNISFEEDIKDSIIINTYFEAYHQTEDNRPYRCAHNFLAKDESYIYIDLVCGNFFKNINGEIETSYGYRAKTRVHLENGNISNFDQVADGNYYFASYNWLFPKEVQERDTLTNLKEAWGGIHLKLFQ